MKKLAPLAALAAVAPLAIPVASWADDGTPQQPQAAGGRIARIQERLLRIEARLQTVQERIDGRCSAEATPSAGDGSAERRADRCARAHARLDRVEARLHRIEQRLENRRQRGDGNASGLSVPDQAALGQLQQQLAGADQ